jgi:hypothetical protein
MPHVPCTGHALIVLCKRCMPCAVNAELDVSNMDATLQRECNTVVVGNVQ